MGYYTNFSLKVQDKEGRYFSDDSSEMKKIAWEFEKITQWLGEEDYQDFCIDYGENLEKYGFDYVFFDDCYKWYGYEENMVELSKHFPDYLFILEGHGEEYGDIWLHYFLNGKNQYSHAAIEFDDCYLR